ncbi:ground-like domain protein [Ancylostoma caninum]|uniref:Ground-like domain protein n=1 Tax=Ancylostoma caninum TaxID=29170 RepID=A0A368H3E0_ANCCA|nr:ground-like domain protein [Ancylostoma caninum]
MSFSYLLCLFTILFFVTPTFSIFFGNMGGGGCCGGCGCGRKKRSVEHLEQERFHADDSDKLCNNPELKRIIRKHMANDPITSKANLVKALLPEGEQFLVMCSSGESVFSAPRSSIFCSSNSFNHTCYVFGF